MDTNHKLAIIGSGPSGLTAAIYTARASIDTTVFSGLQPGGQLTTTTEIENFPGFPEGIDGSLLMENMQKQAERFGSKVIFSEVKHLKIDSNNPNGKFLLEHSNGQDYFDAVIVASGASAKYLGLPDEEKFVGRGYHSCATCDGFFYKGKVIAVVGGGDSAMEEANFLTKFAEKVYLIHRKHEFKASKIMQDRVFANPKIEIVWNKAITELEGVDKVTGIKLQDTLTQETSQMPLDAVFVAIGHVPNTTFAKDILSMDDIGYLYNQTHLAPESRNSKYTTSSTIEGIFVAGDVEDKIYKQAITAAVDGCRAAIDCEKWLEEKADT